MPLINFSGLASGIDSEALIEATSEATRLTRVEPLETEVTEINETNSAFEELKTLLDNVRSAADSFRTLNGGGLSKTGISSDETVVSALASDAAGLGTYDLNVTQLAQNALFSFSERTTDPDANIITTAGDKGRIEIIYGLGTEQKTIGVDVDENTSWAELATQIGTAAFDNGVNISANLVNVGTTSSPSYALFINGNEVGTEKGTISIDTTQANVGDPGGNDAELDGYLDVGSATLQQAQNAQFSLTGITGTIERTSNTVSDLIPGVTFNLQDTGSAQVKVEVDASATQSRVQEIVDAYNELVLFVNENNQITRQEDGEGATNIFSALASTRIDDNAITAIRNTMSASFYDPDGSGDEDTDPANENEVRIFANLGIISDGNSADGTLLFQTDTSSRGLESDTFQQAIANEPDSVEQILVSFADRLSATAQTLDDGTTIGTIDFFTGPNRIIDIASRNNTERLTDLNDRIARAEASIAAQEAALRARFARLESLTSSLQNQQSALTSALAGLG